MHPAEDGGSFQGGRAPGWFLSEGCVAVGAREDIGQLVMEHIYIYPLKKGIYRIS